MNEVILSVDHTMLQNYINTSYKADVPLMVFGAPGIGKSTVIKASAAGLAEQEDREFIDWNNTPSDRRHSLATSLDSSKYFIFADCRLSQYEPSDWAIPWVSKESTEMVWMPSGLLKAFSAKGCHGMLFLDELPQAQPAVQNSAYQIIFDRGYKDVYFPGIRIIAAGNRMSDGGSQYAFAPALANRLAHCELVTPTGENWVNRWALDAGIHPIICAFIRNNPLQMYEDTGATENRRFAWASPRSWEMASKLVSTLPEISSENFDWWVGEANKLLYISVGRGASCEFVVYMKLLNGIILEDFLKSPAKVKEISIDQKLGLIALAQSRMANTNKVGTDKENADLIIAALDIGDNLDRAELRTLLYGAICRAYSKGPNKGARVEEILKTQKGMEKQIERYFAAVIEIQRSMFIDPTEKTK